MKRKDNELTFDERRQIQLEMLDEIDKFCRINNLRYSLAFGTLLGAIRHKGFIPWDDDVDIIMPLEDLEIFKKGFDSNHFEYIDIDNCSIHTQPFSRIAHKETYSKHGLKCRSYGVCIDLYVMVGLPDEYKQYISRAFRYERFFLFMLDLRAKFLYHLPVCNIPFFTKSVQLYRNCLFKNAIEYNTANTFFSISGPICNYKKNIFNIDLFNELVETQFEDRKYLAFGKYVFYLRQCYGDYMQLPPEDQRHPYHGGHFFWK